MARTYVSYGADQRGERGVEKNESDKYCNAVPPLIS